MGGHDVYCVFCGALPCEPYIPEDVEDEDEEEDVFDEDAFGTIGTEWMADVRLIGQNWGATPTGRTFVSGLAQATDNGFFNVQPGNDNDFPDESSGTPVRFLVAFNDPANGPFIAPFHVACMDIFSRVMHHRGHVHKCSNGVGLLENVDKEFMWSALSSLAPDNYGSCLEIDYGAIAETQEQYWVTQRGSEDFAANPLVIPFVEQYFEQPPARIGQQSAFGASFAQTEGYQRRSPLEHLPLELLSTLALNMSTTELVHLGCCSKQLYLSIFGNNQLWANRFVRDMPYLWDAPRYGEATDWMKVYKDMFVASTRSSPARCIGLVNRRRIWSLCTIIAEDYERFYDFDDDFAHEGPAKLIDWSFVESGTVAMTAWPSQHASSTFKTMLLSDHAQDPNSQTIIVATFNSAGLLVDLEVQNSSSQGDGQINPKQKKESIALESDDLVQSIEVFIGDASKPRSQHTGVVGMLLYTRKSQTLQLGKLSNVKRYFHVEPNSITVALAGSISQSGIVSSFGLWSAPQSKVPGTSMIAVSAGTDLRMPDKDSDKYFWRGEYPPRGSKLHAFTSGYSSSDTVRQEPFEFLDFGSTDEQLSSIVAISGDISIGSFSVKFADGSFNQIGSKREAVQTFQVDGTGGERIMEAWTTAGHVNYSVRLVTSKGRNLIFGYLGSQQSSRHAPSNNQPITGLYASWEEGGSALQAIGFVHNSDVSPVGLSQHVDAQCDDEGRFWTPERPPPSVREEGRPTSGDGRSSAERQVTDPMDLPDMAFRAAWLALGDSVARIRLCFAHPSRHVTNVCIVGLVLEKGDGTTTAVGAEELGLTQVPRRSEGRGCGHDCPARDSPQPDEHYWSEVWECEGSRIVKLDVWTDLFLSGVRFETEANLTSPLYGKKQGERVTITLGQGDMLKVLFADNWLMHDAVAVGFQKLARQAS